jgi:plasmid stabilization system protein ParE
VDIVFLEPAQQELDEAVSFYNLQAEGLGNSFLIEAVAAIERIRRYPAGWHPLGSEVRRCRLRRFPYGLIYRVENDDVLIIAVAHSHRQPFYWRDRAKSRNA